MRIQSVDDTHPHRTAPRRPSSAVTLTLPSGSRGQDHTLLLEWQTDDDGVRLTRVHAVMELGMIISRDVTRTRFASRWWADLESACIRALTAGTVHDRSRITPWGIGKA